MSCRMPSVESMRIKIRNKVYIPLTRSIKHRRLISSDFTIISNNCWGGTVYEAYNLQKRSPTVGLFFMADDYIKFLKFLHQYLAAELTFIDPSSSMWKENYTVKSSPRFGKYPIGKLTICIGTSSESIEIFFLHYGSESEAKEKWERRISRINWNKLLVKFNDQNGCTSEHIKEFDALPFKNKVCFTVKAYPQYASVVKIRVPRTHEHIRASYEPIGKAANVNITELLNQL